MIQARPDLYRVASHEGRLFTFPFKDECVSVLLNRPEYPWENGVAERKCTTVDLKLSVTAMFSPRDKATWMIDQRMTFILGEQEIDNTSLIQLKSPIELLSAMILIISSALTTIASVGAAISIGNKKEGFIQSHGSRATPPCFSIPPPPYRPKLRGRMEYSQVRVKGIPTCRLKRKGNGTGVHQSSALLMKRNGTPYSFNSTRGSGEKRRANGETKERGGLVVTQRYDRTVQQNYDPYSGSSGPTNLPKKMNNPCPPRLRSAGVRHCMAHPSDPGRTFGDLMLRVDGLPPLTEIENLPRDKSWKKSSRAEIENSRCKRKSQNHGWMKQVEPMEPGEENAAFLGCGLYLGKESSACIYRFVC
ncbi:hypothetical protein F2Q69_00035896 [Brassica cretica]|uniref:Uncharacterized protein n=1 Tax=Brassica cretica TaxID=69181 RepID=A0A8S9SGX0_BRACR|nr:hypothetical protein F2Q69_00035896 [Brassica cretica]